MRYCIPVSADRDWDSPVHGHFGSAPFFAVIDTTMPRAVEMAPNHNEHHEHGHCNPVAAIKALSVNAVVVGGIGMRAVQRLQESGVAVYRCAGSTVHDVADAIEANTLEALNAEEACQGHGHGEGDCHH